jgi:hypothetical protein
MSNIYDVFRGVQAQKTSCFDERSAAFITEGVLSTDITHVRRNTTIKAAVTFNDKEGPDESIVFTLKTTPSSNELLKGDYYIYNTAYYLVFEDVRVTDGGITWKKQKSVECNVSFYVSNTLVRGYFISMLRSEEDTILKASAAVISQENPLVIVPSNAMFAVGTRITINSKPFKIVEYDAITNLGITYLFLERDYITQSTTPTPIPDPVSTLRPMIEYTFNTLDAYFAATPKVDVLERKSTSIKFVIPYNIASVAISIKTVDGIVTTPYTVIL